MKWYRYVLRRIGFIVLSLFVTSMLVFLLMEIIPGDVAQVMLGQHATEEALAALRTRMGLDNPWYVRYFGWLNQTLHGNLGESMAFAGIKIAPLVIHRAINSILLLIACFVVFVPTSVIFGIIGGIKEEKWVSSFISISGLFMLAIPPFVTGVFLIYLFSQVIPILPASSNIPPGTSIYQNLEVLILPTICVSLLMFGYIARMAQSSMNKVLKSSYIRTAVLKGLSQRYIIFRHALKNAILPTITVIGMNIGWLFGGLIVIEKLFGYPGIGQLLVISLESRDIPLVKVIILLIVFVNLVANFLTDLSYSLFDPRIDIRS